MTQKRKRAPGAGRKPKGEFVGKSATITTRIQPSTRDALEQAARANGRSLSQEVEFRLRAGLKKRTEAQRRNEALACAITLMVEEIEKGTGRSWLEDPFTGLAVRYAIEHFAFFCAAPSTGSADPPPTVVDAAASMPSLYAEQFCKPPGFGHTHAHFIITQIQGAARPPGVPHNEWDMPIFFTAHEVVLRDIGRDLGFNAGKDRNK
jgi:hypothetical protein